VDNVVRSRQHLLNLMEEAGSRSTLDEIDPTLFPGTSAHYGGTTRMHAKPRYGVVDGVATEVPADAPFCLSAPGIASVQLGFGLLDLEALDHGTLAAAGSRGLGINARGCFAGGLLKETLNPAQLAAATPKWQRIMALREHSKSTGRSVLETAAQFCRATPGISVTLLGMRSETHLRENLRHFQAPPLDAEEYIAVRRVQQLDESLT
jgi:aryl-alcohol dehydrogenase-like predicted oxidoreductase